MRRLTINDAVAFAAPASGCPKDVLTESEAYFLHKGYRVKKGFCVYQNHRFVSGTDEDRAFELMSLFKDDDVGAVFSARGGYGSARLLDLLDYGVFKKNPKLFIGLSDTTALQNALLAKAGISSLTGFVLYRRTGFTLAGTSTEKSLWKALNGEKQFFTHLKTLKGGNAEGCLIGGCLSVFTSLIGTPYMPSTKGALLFFEDTGEQPYVIDRLLTHCALAGIFDNVAGVIFGDFTHCTSKDADDGTIDDVLNEWGTKLNVPCVKNLPYGHGETSCVLPLGATAFLDADKGVLIIDEKE